MNKRFSSLAICIFGGAFLMLPVNQMKAESLGFIVESNNQRGKDVVVQNLENKQNIGQRLYGSIAIHGNGNYGNYGYSWNHKTSQSAIDGALQACFESTKGKCQTALWFSNGCGALATAPLSWGSGYGDDKLTAQQNALEKCPSNYCKIQKVFCTSNVAQ